MEIHPHGKSRVVFTALVGTVLMVTTLGTNLWLGSGLSPGEWGVLVYAIALIVSGRFLDARLGRFPIDAAVGWSFPLLLAPLLLVVMHTQVVDPTNGAGPASDIVIGVLMVHPMAWGIGLFGAPNQVVDNSIVIAAADGGLVLGVGLICAGLYPMVLFLGVLTHQVWRTGLEPRMVAVAFLVGASGVYLTNLLRLVLLTRIGAQWGPGTLHMVHANLGWLLFALFLFFFWSGFSARYGSAKPTSAPGKSRGDPVVR